MVTTIPTQSRARLAGGFAGTMLALVAALQTVSARAEPAAEGHALTLESPATHSDAASAAGLRPRLNRHADPAIDGRFLLFGSVAVDMLPSPPESEGYLQVFVRDLVAGTTDMISVADGEAGLGVSTPVDISADGRWVVFTSGAANLVEGVVDDNGLLDVFLHDRISRSTRLVSRSAADPLRAANGVSRAVDLSADGSWLLFSSTASQLVAGGGDTNQAEDVFLYARDSGEIRLVSRASGGAAAANGRSEAVALSDNGNWILFHSAATNLVEGVSDTNGLFDVFVQDRQSAQTLLVSRSSNGASTGNFRSQAHAISANGDRVLFASEASNLVAGLTDSNLVDDVFYWTRSTGLISLVSRRVGQAATPSGRSVPAAISADGQSISFRSDVPALFLTGTELDGNAGFDVFLHACSSGENRLVSRGHTGAVAADNASFPIALSSNGRHLLFHSRATDLVPGVVDDNGVDDLFTHDRVQGSTRLVSSSVLQPGRSANGRTADGDLNALGTRTAFLSPADDLQVDRIDRNGELDLHIWDGPGTAVALVSVREAAPTLRRTASGMSSPSAISADGRWLLMSSKAADLGEGIDDRNDAFDLFLRDRESGEIVLVSRSASSALQTANAHADSGVMSADARWVLYRSAASDVVPDVSDTNQTWDAFLFDRESRTTVLVSHAAGQPDLAANGDSLGQAISDDGRWILYGSSANNAVAGVSDANGLHDVFLWDRNTRAATLVSRAGSTASTANWASTGQALSADGRWAVIVSGASNLVPGIVDSNASADLFLFDRQTGTMRLVSRAAGTSQAANGDAQFGNMTRDGRWIGFTHRSQASNLVPGIVQTETATHAFLYDRETDASVLISHAAGLPLRAANGSSQRNLYPSADGRWWLHDSRGSNLDAGVVDFNGADDVFLYDRYSNESRLVSRSIDPAIAANSASRGRGLSADGQRVVLTSVATNLLGGVTDLNGADDAYAVQASSGVTTLLSRSHADSWRTGNGASVSSSVSADGSVIVLGTFARDLVPGVIDLNSSIDVVSLSFSIAEPIFANGFE